jgi:hypothetical protein
MRVGAATDEARGIVAQGRALLVHALRAGWDRGLLRHNVEDGLFANALGEVEVRALAEQLGSSSPDHPEARPLPSRAAQLPRLAALLAQIDATEVAAELLVMVLAVELDGVSRGLAGYLRGLSGAALSIDACALALGDARVPELLDQLAMGGPLRRHRLVEVTDKQSELSAAATVRAAPRLLRWVHAPHAVDDEVAAFAQLIPAEEASRLSPATAAALEPYIEEVRVFLQNQRRTRATSDLVLRGPRGAGRTEVAREACRRLGIPLLIAPVASLAGWSDPTAAMQALLREEVLLDGQILLEGGESLVNSDGATQQLRAVVGTSFRPLLISSSGDDLPRLWSTRRLVVRDVPILAADQRAKVWRELLPEVPADEIASLYRVGAGAIGRIADGARLRAELRSDGRSTVADVAQSVRSEFATDLGTVAQRVEVSQGWDDLVVPDDIGRTIAELVEQLRHRALVLGRWGFQRKLGKGVGTTALFSGEPGTGKSMVAGLIAKTLGLELYQIDLSRVMSKWIGETEKNLAKVFDAAETGHVVLLFDEADALLGKRTSDVKSANDRYANLETNYILQRIEQFHGIAILTSNLEKSIDPALSRRLSFELRFPFPDVEQRTEIWRRMLPAELPIAGEIDFHKFADRFEIAGGHIRNVVLRAAYLAASDGSSLTEAHLMRAAEYEYRDHGMLMARGRLKS